MKHPLLFLFFFFLAQMVMSQNYQISFAGQGASNTVDSVLIENLSQNTSLKMSGTDILQLGTSGIDDYSQNQKLTIYPNPFSDYCNIYFNVPVSGNAIIKVFDIIGKDIFSKIEYFEKGNASFQLSGLSSGSYVVHISNSEYSYYGKLISNSSISKGNVILLLNSFVNQSITLHPKNDSQVENDIKLSIVVMQYNTGDRLKLTGFSGLNGLYKNVIMLIPNNNQTVTFDFNPCTDLDGNHYATVEINGQIWMAENLKYLPSVIGSAIGSNTEPYFYVYGYQGNNLDTAKSTVNFNTYGVLYNWSAAMAGASGSNLNPSGVQGVCPIGWHIPSNAEWIQLFNFCGELSVLGGKFKETGFVHWNGPNTGATNEFGFSLLPGGDRNYNLIFQSIRQSGIYWTSSAYNNTNSMFIRVGFNYTELVSFYIDKELALSIRCVKN